MDHETIQAIALMLGASWASGINLYAAILVLGILGNTGYADLPEGMALVENPLVLGVAGIMYFIEFFADKTPGVDSGWDAIHTFIRIPAGAMMAVGAASGMEVNQAVTLAAALLGGGVASHDQHLTRARHQLGGLIYRRYCCHRRTVGRIDLSVAVYRDVHCFHAAGDLAAAQDLARTEIHCA